MWFYENVVILTMFCPPLAVLVLRGIGRLFWANCILTFLGFYPGVLHAVSELERQRTSSVIAKI